MGLVQCPDCGQQVSDQAPACVSCGRPMADQGEVQHCRRCQQKGKEVPLAPHTTKKVPGGANFVAIVFMISGVIRPAGVGPRDRGHPDRHPDLVARQEGSARPEVPRVQRGAVLVASPLPLPVQKQMGDPNMSHREMAYELAIRYVFDRCERGQGPQGLADEDYADDPRDTSKALRAALARIADDAATVGWTDEEAGRGGLKPNFLGPLRAAEEALRDPDEASARSALALTIHALKALTLKAAGAHPGKYRGDSTQPADV